MPRRNVLAESQRQLFEQIPDEPKYLAQHYTLSLEDIDLIRQRRRASNRLGFAIQLCLMRYPGRSLRTGEQLPEVFIEFVAEQIEDHPIEFIEYAQRDETRREHQLILTKYFDLLTFKTCHFKELVQWLAPIAFDNPKSVFLVGALLNEMQHRCILHPPLRWTADWYIRDECYSRALAEIINHHHNTDLVGSWGDGTTSSSDGQHFSLGGTGKALGEVNARYGNTPGVLFYTHISDQYSPFHSKLINATASVKGSVTNGTYLSVSH